jgi:hypothetical protein
LERQHWIGILGNGACHSPKKSFFTVCSTKGIERIGSYGAPLNYITLYKWLKLCKKTWKERKVNKFVNYCIFIITIIYPFIPLIPINTYTISTGFYGISIIMLFSSIFLYKIKYLPLVLLLLCRILLVFLSIISFTKALIILNISSYELIEDYVILRLIIFVTILFIIFMGHYFYRIIKSISELEEAQTKLEKVASYIILFFRLLGTLIIPNAVFGIIYQLLLGTFHNIALGFYEGIYLSFVIDYTLPINGEILTIFETIDSSNSLKTLQVAHIIISRIIDLTVIAIFISYINAQLNNLRSIRKS